MTITTFDPTKLDLSAERVNALLDELVAEKGADYVYPRSAKDDYGDQLDSCVNTELDEDGNIVPSCIVGHVWVRAGIPADLIDANYWGSTARGVVNALGLNVDPETEDLLAYAQQLQDNGVPWGRAVEQARELVASNASQGRYGED